MQVHKGLKPLAPDTRILEEFFIFMPKRLISLVALLLLVSVAWGNMMDPRYAEDYEPISDPIPLSPINPEYPESLIGTGWEGECTVGFYVSEEGEVLKAWIVRSTGREDADELTLEAAQNLQWKPGRQGDQAIARQVSLTVRFFPEDVAGLTPAEPLSVPDPVYPSQLQETSWSGQTRLGLSIDDLGMVLKAWVIDSSGRADADEAARNVAFVSLWQPASYLGEPLDSQAELVVEFYPDLTADEVSNALDEDWDGPEEDDWEPPEDLNNPGGDGPRR